MRILFAGPLWTGSTSVYRVDALRELGHEVVTVDTMPPDPRREHALFARVLNRLGFPPDLAGANARLRRVAAAGGFDVVWVEKGRTLRPSTLRAVRRANPGAPLVSYALDDMMNPRNQSRAWRASVPVYDVHVTTKTYNVHELPRLGARRVLFSGNAYAPAVHRPMTLTPAERARWGSEVVFVGQVEADRLALIRALVAAGVEVTVHGPDWARHRGEHPGLKVGEPWVADADYARVVSGAKISLGFLRKANRDLQTTRSVEIPACGGFMLAERTDEHLALFAEGVEAEFFEGADELIRKTKTYLEHDEARCRIAAAGRERCLRGGYGYPERLAGVLAALGLDARPAAAALAARSGGR